MLLRRLFLICGRRVSQAWRALNSVNGGWDFVHSRQSPCPALLSCHDYVLSAVGTDYLLTSSPITHKVDGGSTAVSGPAEPALRIKTSSEPAVTLDTSAAASFNLVGSEMSVTMMWMFLRCAASSLSGPAVPKLRIRAKTWLFGSVDFSATVSGVSWL